MPPKPKFTREELVMAALDMVRKDGIAALTARDLGARLGTSARPIFTAFANMEELKNEVAKAAAAFFKSYAEHFTEYVPAFKQMGMQMVSFAKEEPHLFAFLFMQKNPSASGDLEELERECTEILEREHDLSAEDAKMLFAQVWTFTFGLSVFSAMGVYAFEEEEISEMLTREFTGAVLMIKSDANKKKITKPIKKREGL